MFCPCPLEEQNVHKKVITPKEHATYPSTVLMKQQITFTKHVFDSSVIYVHTLYYDALL